MRILRSATVILFVVIIILPLAFFNFEENSVSAIDNRMLAENPLTANSQGDLTVNVENYVSDRVGFRDDMILAYTVINDKIFNKMVHPSYTYGKDGYIFGSGITTKGYFTDYHIAFADMVEKLQKYCEDREVPFLFVFNPAKPAVLSEYIKGGIAYSRDWVDLFFSELDKRGVNYLDNTVTLINAKESGKTVFNKKYDANHWNYLGAYYGTNAILETLKKSLDKLHINSLDEFIVGEEIKTSLPVSMFPINEAVPTVELNTEYEDISSKYSNELYMDPSYRSFGYYINSQRRSQEAPTALVFQGSYMNGFGYKYLINSFGEYISVHDYQNVLNLPYYYNIFKPDCVVFEVAEYTFLNIYFDYETMLSLEYNSPLDSYKECRCLFKSINDESFVTEAGETLTKICWETDIDAEAVWFLTDSEFDMQKHENGYEATVKTSEYEKFSDSFRIACLIGEEMIYYE